MKSLEINQTLTSLQLDAVEIKEDEHQIISDEKHKNNTLKISKILNENCQRLDPPNPIYQKIDDIREIDFDTEIACFDSKVGIHEFMLLLLPKLKTISLSCFQKVF